MKGIKSGRRCLAPAVFISLAVLLTASWASSQEVKEIPAFDKDDRVLILAAHPDDEAISAGGVIQRALSSGARLKVVSYTNGDNNEPAFIVYEKRLTFRKGEFIHMGEVRKDETIKAMRYLGLSEDDLIFLGYPDFGTMEILTKYWGKTRPFKSFFARSSKVPYPDCLSPGSPYVGESILGDLKRVIIDFKPTKIFVGHPADTNRDHRSCYLFLQIALWDLEGQIARPKVFPCITHVVGWPKPRGYHPELVLAPPQALTGVVWEKLSLTENEVEKKRGCIAFYKSQIECDPPYLFTFARKNELFGDYPILALSSQGESAQDGGIEDTLSAVSYTNKDNNLYIRLNLRRKIDKNFGISVFLLGYSRHRAFAEMPKIAVTLGILGMRIKEKRTPIIIKDARYAYDGSAILLKIPLAGLGDPDYILSSARAVRLGYDQTAWRILKLK